MQKTPHMLIEGIVIASYAAGANRSFIYIRGEYVLQADVLDAALGEAREAGYIGEDILGSGHSLSLVVHRGAGAYICGEETGLLDSLEGKRGNPRLKPPFPANQGLYQGPTLINNVETLSTVPTIIRMGGEEYAKLGVETSTGTKLVSVSGHVQRPGNYEIELGIPSREIIYGLAGGPPEGRGVKCWFPGGSSSPVLTADDLDVPYDFDSLAKAGSMLGSGRDHRRRRLDADPRRRAEDREVLPARVVRQVHAVPRGHQLDGEDARADRGRRGDADGPRDHGLGPGAHHRQLPVRARRRDGDADRLDDREVPRRVRSAHRARADRDGSARGRRRAGARRAGDSGGDARRRDHGRPATGTRKAAPRCHAEPRDHLHDRRPRGAGAREHDARRRRQARRRRDPGLLLRAEARPARRRLPHVPGRDRGHPEAADRLLDAGQGRHGRLHADRAREDRAAVGRRVPADQPPARLPRLRQGRRVPAAGHHVRLGRRHLPLHRAQAPLRQAARALAADRDRPRALHPLLPLRALLPGGLRGLPAGAARARRALLRRDLRRAPLRGAVQRQHRRAVPGRARSPRAPTASARGRGTSRAPARSARFCPAQCNVTLTVRDERALRVLARDNDEVDDGWLCDKGRFAYQSFHVDERITEPLLRDGGELRPVSWERALTEAAAGLRRAGERAAAHRGRPGDRRGGPPARAPDARGRSAPRTSTRAAAAPCRSSCTARSAPPRCRRASPTSSSPTPCSCSTPSPSTTRRSSTCACARACAATAWSWPWRCPRELARRRRDGCRCASPRAGGGLRRGRWPRRSASADDAELERLAALGRQRRRRAARAGRAARGARTGRGRRAGAARGRDPVRRAPASRGPTARPARAALLQIADAARARRRSRARGCSRSRRPPTAAACARRACCRTPARARRAPRRRRPRRARDRRGPRGRRAAGALPAAAATRCATCPTPSCGGARWPAPARSSRTPRS